MFDFVAPLVKKLQKMPEKLSLMDEFLVDTGLVSQIHSIENII